MPSRTAPPEGAVGCRQPTCLGTCGASFSRSVCLNRVSEVLPLFFGKCDQEGPGRQGNVFSGKMDLKTILFALGLYVDTCYQLMFLI